MADTTTDDLIEQLDIREKIAHIDQMLADVDHKFADQHRIISQIELSQADRDRERQEIRLAPWALVLGGVGTGAALFAAAAAFTKLLL